MSWIIVITIAMTVVVQGYWNWRNYEENKRFLISEIQVALDNSVEQYYAQLAKIHFVQMNDDQLIEPQINRILTETNVTDSIISQSHQINGTEKEFQKFEWNTDSVVTETHSSMVIVGKLSSADTVEGTQKRFVKLASRLAMSLEADSLDYNTLDSLLTIELVRKGINDEFEIIRGLPPVHSSKKLAVQANSTYLAAGNELFLSITPSFGVILKKGIIGVLISVITALVIIGVLIYLYRFIQHQKSLDLMKNDLISNITHEFKTPIATVSTALEAIEKFNTEKDLAKTAKYLNISNEQLTKLNGMVEKLLDTATLEESELQLNPLRTELTNLIQTITDHYKSTCRKSISFKGDNDIWAQVDVFHFENVISNLIDNALKYGGDQINIALKKDEGQIEISVSDNGTGINKKEQIKIFDKFYRISSGNVHDVKGYGIGLYYARTIVEKHGGKLTVLSTNDKTIFKINIPA
ncbi:sensor histidine kinase [Reichenbachiella sp.]|uniref:sensor histidine kinase n=1 Tax=Reichenbachiella sp. TaxID=2184521 RepID=UPI003B5CD546